LQNEQARASVSACLIFYISTLENIVVRAPGAFGRGYDVQMRHATKVISILVLAAAALNAQDELAQYQTWMKSAVAANTAAKAAIAAKDNSAVADSAKKLSESFDQIAKFWEKKHKDDAVKLAETARDAGKSLASATSPEDQTAALQKVGGTCRGCHQVYREGSNFKN
jgi:hypothetical protein